MHVRGVNGRVRAALRYVSTEHSRPVARDLKKIYQAATVIEAEQALEEFAQAWDEKYPTIAKQWRTKRADIITLFDFPAPIRKAIDTTNAIESVNSVTVLAPALFGRRRGGHIDREMTMSVSPLKYTRTQLSSHSARF